MPHIAAPSGGFLLENTMQFLAGFICASAIAGLIWGYRAWITKKATDLEARIEQSAKDVVGKVKAKL